MHLTLQAPVDGGLLAGSSNDPTLAGRDVVYGFRYTFEPVLHEVAA